MGDFTVRPLRPADEPERRRILELATQELRAIYRPRQGARRRGAEPAGVLVAVDGTTLAGTLEYVLERSGLYIQGVAVHPEYRGQGGCRTLLDAAAQEARGKRFRKLTLQVIAQTGNVDVFRRLGFEITSQAVSNDYVAPDGSPVIQVAMARVID